VVRRFYFHFFFSVPWGGIRVNDQVVRLARQGALAGKYKKEKAIYVRTRVPTPFFV
jgi:hypothetical protein